MSSIIHKFTLSFMLSCAMAIPSLAVSSQEKTCDLLGQREDAESFAEYLFRYRIVEADKVTGILRINETEFLENFQDLERLWQTFESGTKMSPFMLRVRYTNTFKAKPEEVARDPMATAKDVVYRDAYSMRSYIEKSLPEMSKKLANGYQPITLSFERVQEKDFIERVSLADETLRICGITQKIEAFLKNELVNYLSSYGLHHEVSFFYGSRVMPRSNVILKDPSFAKTMTVIDDGVVKNAVRIRGLTRISDLELIMIASSFSKPRSKEELKAITQGFKRHVLRKFRDFSVSLRIIEVGAREEVTDPFSLLDQRCQALGRKPLSRHQFASAFSF